MQNLGIGLVAGGEMRWQAGSGSLDRLREDRWCADLVAKDDMGSGRVLDGWVPSDRGKVACRTNARKQESGVARSIHNEERGAVEQGPLADGDVGRDVHAQCDHRHAVVQLQASSFGGQEVGHLRSVTGWLQNRSQDIELFRPCAGFSTEVAAKR